MMLFCMLQILEFLIFLSPAVVGVSESVRKCMLGGMARVYRMTGSRAIQLITRIVSF
jgi:hypothetical protein